MCIQQASAGAAVEVTEAACRMQDDVDMLLVVWWFLAAETSDRRVAGSLVGHTSPADAHAQQPKQSFYFGQFSGQPLY